MGTSRRNLVICLLIAAPVSAAWAALAANAGDSQAGNGAVMNERFIEVLDSDVLLRLWEQEVEGGLIAPFYSIALDGRTYSRSRQTDYLIKLRYSNFDPTVATPNVPAALTAGEDNELYLVQFVVPPLEPFREEIRALGGTVLRFLSNHTHIVRMNAMSSDAVAELPFVRWVGRFHAAYKADDAILGAYAAGFPESEAVRFSIEVFERGAAQQAAVKTAIEAAGGVVHFITPLGFRMEAALAPQLLLSVLHMDEVHVVHPIVYGENMEDMDIVRQISGANFIENNTGFTGQGVRGESFDSGFQIDHQDFTPTPIWRTTSRLASHGTATYGVCFGTGFGNATARGLNPDLEQGFVSYYGVTTQFGGPITRHSLTESAVDPNGDVRILFQTSSVGPYRTRVYDSISAETDDYLFLYDLLSFQSMSNANGTPDVRPCAWAKNIIGVGGIRHQNTLNRNDDSAAGSSGPAQDGRIKPDLSHFYDSVWTTYSSSTTGYGQFSGTSSATPCTAGHSGLLFQMWHEEVFPGHGGGASVFDSRAKMATAKAMMINSAFKYPLNQGGLTRIRQGWGMVDLEKLYERRNETFIVDETDLLTPLGVNCYEVEVAVGQSELGVTMVYTDLMGPTSSTQHRINDLSLRVTSPGGVSYWGNNGLMTSHLSAPGGSSNTKDTVENVFISDPEPGTWTVEVLGDEIIEDSHPETPELDADYALVVSGVVDAAACGACDPCDMNCDTIVDALDIEFFIDLLFNGTDPCCGNRGDIGSSGDVNLDGIIDADDIEGFLNCLFP